MTRTANSGDPVFDVYIDALIAEYESMKSTAIPFQVCSVTGANWSLVSGNAIVDPGDDEDTFLEISVRFNGSWAVRVGLWGGDSSLQGFYQGVSSSEADCCGGSVNVEVYDEGFGPTFGITLSSSTVTVVVNKGSTCCNDAGTCIEGTDHDCDGDCSSCTASGTPCTPHCTDVTPEQYQVTFSGVTACGCLTNGTNSSEQWTLAAVVNGPFTLTQVPGSSCSWTASIPNAASHKFWDAATGVTDCTGPESSSFELPSLIRLTRTATEWTLTVEDFLGFSVFRDTVAEISAGECATVPSFANEEVCAYASLGVAYGGEATVVCL